MLVRRQRRLQFEAGGHFARAHWTWITPAVDAWDKFAVHAKIALTMCIDVPLTRLLVLATCKLRDLFADEFHLPALPPWHEEDASIRIAMEVLRGS